MIGLLALVNLGYVFILIVFSLLISVSSFWSENVKLWLVLFFVLSLITQTIECAAKIFLQMFLYVYWILPVLL